MQEYVYNYCMFSRVCADVVADYLDEWCHTAPWFNDHYMTLLKPGPTVSDVLQSIWSNAHFASATRHHLCSIFTHNSASAHAFNKLFKQQLGGRSGSENTPEYLRMKCCWLKKKKMEGLDKRHVCLLLRLRCIIYSSSLWLSSCALMCVHVCVGVCMCSCIFFFPLQLIDIKA